MIAAFFTMIDIIWSMGKDMGAEHQYGTSGYPSKFLGIAVVD